MPARLKKYAPWVKKYRIVRAAGLYLYWQRAVQFSIIQRLLRETQVQLLEHPRF